jgi:hypothetical protein
VRAAGAISDIRGWNPRLIGRTGEGNTSFASLGPDATELGRGNRHHGDASLRRMAGRKQEGASSCVPRGGPLVAACPGRAVSRS